MIVVFQCYWKTYSVLDVSRSIAANNVSFDVSSSQEYAYQKEKDFVHEFDFDEGRDSRKEEDAVQNMQFVSQKVPSKGIKIVDADWSKFDIAERSSNGSRIQQSVEIIPPNRKPQLLKTPLSILNNEWIISSSTMRSNFVLSSLASMNSLLLQSYNVSSMKPKWSTRPDRELLSAKLEIENAHAISKYSSELYAPVFRDVSKFSRSYELMEHKLKVYIYKEGVKPIFHQPKMRGLYASEGWFMKLMEGNKRFIVKDPKKAHLFYLPFSSQMLRATLSDNKQMELYLERYVTLLAGKYRFWNRTEGADHFLVACHDWASRITKQPMKSCIRSLCNANVAKGFQVGKDTTLPVTYIHSAMDPLRRFAGKPPSERTILAFFAGSDHGYLRPLLLKHWENKEPDMKIFGPMTRDIEGKKIYMEYMNSSKYCICARGYEVHSPRIVEVIFSECVPVIISDNYVPPFFEVLNWEAFSIFVRERDIPSLRSILLSIPEEKYLALHLGVKKVQQHFLWHKIPVKYDLFHMILHAVWNNRLSQMRPW